MHYLNPLGAFGSAVKPGPGIQALAAFNSPFKIPFDIQFITGYYDFMPGHEAMKYFYMVPLYLCALYKFSLTRNINFLLSAGAGYVFSRISSDSSRNTDGLYWDNKSLYYNPAAVIKIELDIFLYDRWYLVFTPQYNVFFEEKAGQFASIGLGLKMLF
jgi:hypothetical protein